ncbi:hypothetical protein [Maritimibacter sp. HL-12]|jgi:hypothetical protein|uniref:hypothetical protein n=1 Tax=Maritimibacter sp. HL-12 TaxID=1162418 RepID=UPI000A0F0703|nr:hypothetical protein [Maritimibacter sp. HL-12]SMH50115.1 hypothetical protein SAMN05661107_2272 [Maritimibacter sp. HL-12]
MSFIRPEVREGLQRWREVIAAGAVIALALWWAFTGFGVIRWIGWALVIGGTALLWAGLQRARFHGGHGGLGVVEVDERQIAYLAPVGGGIASLDLLTEVSLGPDRSGLPVWHFRTGYETLAIPASAEGTEQLFDALTALPGVDIEAAIRASRSRPEHSIVIWTRPVAHLH